MKLRLAAFLVLVLLVGCKTHGHSFVELRNIGTDYQQSVIRWTSGSTMTIRLKATNEQGFLGVCGYFISDGGIQGAIEQAYLVQSTMQIGDQQITDSADFITELKKDENGNYPATCVKTEVPYQNDFAHQRLRIIGPSSVTIWH